MSYKIAQKALLYLINDSILIIGQNYEYLNLLYEVIELQLSLKCKVFKIIFLIQNRMFAHWRVAMSQFSQCCFPC